MSDALVQRRAATLALLATLEREFAAAELDSALERVAAGTYGICEVCGLPIPPERLDARPGARTHVACAR